MRQEGRARAAVSGGRAGQEVASFMWHVTCLWKPAPSVGELRRALTDYVAGLAVSVEWVNDRFLVRLPWSPASSRQRFFEVWVGDACIDVITRVADDVTNSIASGFADVCARGWGGRVG